jgi:hypothetical protein
MRGVVGDLRGDDDDELGDVEADRFSRSGSHQSVRDRSSGEEPPYRSGPNPNQSQLTRPRIPSASQTWFLGIQTSSAPSNKFLNALVPASSLPPDDPGCFEVKLKGNPWVSVGIEVIQVSRRNQINSSSVRTR